MGLSCLVTFLVCTIHMWKIDINNCWQEPEHNPSYHTGAWAHSGSLRDNGTQVGNALLLYGIVAQGNATLYCSTG